MKLVNYWDNYNEMHGQQKVKNVLSKFLKFGCSLFCPISIKKENNIFIILYHTRSEPVTWRA